MKIFTVDQMITAEKEADAHGQSYAAMMEQAGRGVAEAIKARYAVPDKRILVLVGPGNNGGDGLVAGRYLAQAGAKVVFYLYKERTAVDDPNFAQIQELDLPVLVAEHDQRYRVLRLRLNGCDMVVDTLLGTGVTRPIGGELGQLLRQVRAGLDERAQIMAQEAGMVDESGLTTITAVFSPSPAEPPRPQVIAVDCPSGLNCDTGELDPLALAADLTVTFGGPKQGHFLFPGAGACGQLVTADIGLNPRHESVKQVRWRVALREKIAAKMPSRPLDGHKGTFGRVLVVAGSSQYRGAALLSGRGALRAGAGLVAIATPAVVRHTAVSTLPEATYPALSATDLLDDTAVDELRPTLPHYKAVLIGPGLDKANSFFLNFLRELNQLDNPPPLVIDADGLNILAQQPNWPALLPPHTILTPHPAELARLLDQPLAEVLAANRLTLALDCAARWGCVLVSKGAYTAVAAPHPQYGSVGTVIPLAAPALGTAGSGDVLAGVITALLGQGMAAYDAAVVGAFWHGRVGAYLTAKIGSSGVLASEIADALPYTRP